MHTNIFSFGKRILPNYDTCDIIKQYGATHGIKMMCVQQGFLVNHWHDILNCSCKWLCFNNSYRGIAYMLSFRNADAGDLYVNWRGLGYWRIVRKSEWFMILESCT